MLKLIERIKEPSSQAVLAAFFGIMGVHIGPELWGYIASAVAALAGLAGFFMSEKGGK